MFVSTSPEHKSFARDCLGPVSDDTMTLSHGYIDMNNTFQSFSMFIYIRECYNLLFENVITRSRINQKSFSHGPKTPFILGTPGIGKSLMRMYFCHRLLGLSQEQNRGAYIIFQKGSGDKYTYIVRKLVSDVQAELLIYKSSDSVVLSKFIDEWEQAESLVVSLVDVSEGIYIPNGYTTPRANHTIYFSSPNDILFEKADRTGKESRGFDVFMPVWSLEELQKAAALVVPLLNSALIEERYHEFGGVARVVLGNDAAVNEARMKLNDRIENLKNEPKKFLDVFFRSKKAGDDSEFIKTKSLFSTKFSQALLHVTTENGKFDEPTYRWASPRIASKAASHLLCLNADVADQYINSCSLSGGVKGELVERIWLDRFKLACCVNSESNLMTVKALGDATIISGVELHSLLTNIKHLEEEWYLKEPMKDGLTAAIERVKNKNWQAGSAILLRSLTFSLDAIDAILVIKYKKGVLVLYLQATLSSRHPTDGARAAESQDSLMSIASSLKAKSALLFLVPKHRYLDFTRQTIAITNTDGLPQYAVLPGITLSKKEATKAAEKYAKRKVDGKESSSKKRRTK